MLSNERSNVPALEPSTLEVVAEHHIRAAILKAGSVIMVEKEKILATAAKHKIQLIGF